MIACPRSDRRNATGIERFKAYLLNNQNVAGMWLKCGGWGASLHAKPRARRGRFRIITLEVTVCQHRFEFEVSKSPAEEKMQNFGCETSARRSR